MGWIDDVLLEGEGGDDAAKDSGDAICGKKMKNLFQSRNYHSSSNRHIQFNS